MINTVSQPLGPYFDQDGELNVAGALSFLSKGTDNPKSVWTDEALTVAAPNPMIIGSDGYLTQQPFLETGDYTIIEYGLASSATTSPTFPTDYYHIRQYDLSGGSATAVITSATTVDTIADLSNVAVSNSIVNVLGYFSADDQIPTRTYYWDAGSVTAADGGYCIASNVDASGRWKLKLDSVFADIRYWGAIPGSSADANAAISAAASYANRSAVTAPVQKTLYIPGGVYTVVPAAIAFNTPFLHDPKATFNVRTSGTFSILPYAAWEINLETSLAHSSTSGTARFDFSNSDFYGTVKPEWYAGSFSEAALYAGSGEVVVTSANVWNSTTSADIRKVTFEGGSLDIQGTTPVKIRETAAPIGTPVYLGAGTGSYTQLILGGRIYKSWINTADLVRYCGTTDDTELVLDTSLSYLSGTSVTFDISQWNKLSSTGGSVYVHPSTAWTNSVAVKVPKNVLGQCLAPYDGGYITTDHKFNASNFDLSDGNFSESFIKSCLVNGQIADFQGTYVNDTIDLQNIGSCSISNLVVDTLALVQTGSSVENVILNDVTVLDRMYNGNFSNVSANNSTLTYTTTAANDIYNINLNSCKLTLSTSDNEYTEFRASNTVITNAGANAAAYSINCRDLILNNCVVEKCTIISELSTDYDSRVSIKDSLFRSAYWDPTGTLTSATIMIKGNEFEPILLEGLYEPIKQDNLDCPSPGLSSIRVDISGNSPSLTTLTLAAPLATGTAVRQTIINGKANLVGSSTSNYFLLPGVSQNFMWTPGLEIGDTIRNARITNTEYLGTTSPYTSLKIVDNGTGIASLKFNTVISAGGLHAVSLDIDLYNH